MDEAKTVELANDVIITSVMNLRQDIRKQFICEETDFIVTRPQGRARSLVIEQEVAEFLQAFRKPITFIQAVQAFSSKNKLEVSAFLRDIEDVITQLCKSRFLIVSGSELSKGYSFSVGDVINDKTVLGGITILEDTEIYRCRNRQGQQLALKIAKSEGDKRTNRMIEREYEILFAAPHPLTPIPHKTGKHQNRSYIFMAWCEGRDILSAANQLRKSNPGTYPFNQLNALVVNLIRAYQLLHNAKIIHGDIHPKNCLLTDEGEIRIIDFGLSHSLNGFDECSAPERLGVPYFYDPSFAKAYREGKAPPFASITTDLYSLAALSFLLLTGYHYLPFRFNYKQFYQQIEYEPVRSFLSVGIQSWPEVEAILIRALSKDEKDRFPCAKDFADALESHEFDPKKCIRIKKKIDPIVSQAVIYRYKSSGLEFDWPLLAPRASFHFGAAGIAYALLKCAEQQQDSTVLSDADIWITRAKQDRTSKAVINEDIGLTKQVATPYSLHYGGLGVCICYAMIAYARWDCTAVNKSLTEISELALNASNDFDLTYGKAGALLGCALVLETIPDDPLLHKKRSIMETGQRLAKDLSESLQLLGQISTNEVIMDYGMAHGWAGILYALLRWAEVSQALPHDIVGHYLEELAILSIPGKIGRSWPLRIGKIPGKTETFCASWCKGASGFVHLFSIAAKILKKPYFLSIAKDAADFSFAAPQNGISLCCGDAGIAYAQLVMFRGTQDEKYLEQARFLANRAINTDLKSDSSLYKGQLGLHLLRVELENPETARMPFFEARV